MKEETTLIANLAGELGMKENPLLNTGRCYRALWSRVHEL